VSANMSHDAFEDAQLCAAWRYAGGFPPCCAEMSDCAVHPWSSRPPKPAFMKDGDWQVRALCLHVPPSKRRRSRAGACRPGKVAICASSVAAGAEPGRAAACASHQCPNDDCGNVNFAYREEVRPTTTERGSHAKSRQSLHGCVK
jgi:hypothetical protein